MVDSLDMHAILGDGLAFRQAVDTILRDFQSGLLSFDRDVMVSVFEASIRVLGGLVSTVSAPGSRALALPGNSPISQVKLRCSVNLLKEGVGARHGLTVVQIAAT